MFSKKQFEALKAIAIIPDGDRAAWLAAAENSIAFLKANALTDAVVLYASMPCAWIASAMALNDNLKPVDRADLREAYLQLDDTWVVQKSYGGGAGHKVYLEPPLASASKTLEGGEIPVYRRIFHGMDRREPLELNQKLVHALGVFYVDHRSAYCRLDANGDLEDVISIHSEDGPGPYDTREMVTIRSKDLAEYLALSGMTLVRRFDFTRVDHTTFSGWGEPERSMRGGDDLYYSLGLGGGNGSWANGYQLLRSSVTVDDLVAAFEAESSGRSQREYESFKAWDWKNQALVETSCAPDATANYFTKSDLPFELSPAFFRAEVLARYKADPDKYRLDDRSITCRNAWYLKTYDINEAGQVHTYLCYLADLPIAEQRYWKAFNEEPKGGISKRAYETDFEGQWSSEYDALAELKRKIEVLNASGHPWWSTRTSTLLDTTRYPATDAEKEWADEILALDQLVVEGFVEREIKRITQEAGGAPAANPGGLNGLIAALTARGLLPADAAHVVAPLKTLHHLRSKVRGHSSPREKEELARKALKEFGSYRAHFANLTSDCDAALARIMAGLGL